MHERQPAKSTQRTSGRIAKSSNKSAVLYIVIVSLVVFSMLLAGLAAIDWSAIFSTNPEPTPDYAMNAIALQQTVVAQDPQNMDEQALLASMLANSGRMSEAIPVYERAIAVQPENVSLRLDFARSLQTNDLPADAEQQYVRVLELEPENHTAHYYLGRLYLGWQPQRRDDAVLHLERVIEIAPNSFLAEQARNVLRTLGPATPSQYKETPISSPTGAG